MMWVPGAATPTHGPDMLLSSAAPLASTAPTDST
ncbi:hypothetical protein PICSAR164_04601 [Mycobacterium avium subsp. paratuberculosis]|nr:hypothetical protein PICSAR164_04601 [Mycobacterium avium subsp. paratuberculosis]CAG7109186.1 hypothetical protein PICSAR181_04572 [Mycobacterium avium subsp. paratuberculosis]